MTIKQNPADCEVPPPRPVVFVRPCITSPLSAPLPEPNTGCVPTNHKVNKMMQSPVRQCILLSTQSEFNCAYQKPVETIDQDTNSLLPLPLDLPPGEHVIQWPRDWQVSPGWLGFAILWGIGLERNWMGLPWWSSGWDSMLPMPGFNP